MIWTVVHYGWEGDGITALYDSEGKLHLVGDEYHDQIGTYIEGFLEGTRYAGETMVRIDKYVNQDNFDVVYGEGACDSLDELYSKYKVWNKEELE